MKSKISKLLFYVTLQCLVVFSTGQTSEFLKLHPENPHYFQFRGKAQVLITATEHYGAVQNLDFDYISYLDMLQEHGFNLTRIFLYFREHEKEFSGTLGYQNTLAPRPGRWCAPWQRSSTPRADFYGNKFDLDRWNEDYFKRLDDFCIEAGKRNIVVEVVLFSTTYWPANTVPWKWSPMNATNNINDVGNIEGEKFLTLQDETLVKYQVAFVQKVVETLKFRDNIYYEICNEPTWSTFRCPRDGRVYNLTFDWHQHIISSIRNAELSFPNKHLIAVNYNNYNNLNNHFPSITNPEEIVRGMENVSILNFHYNSYAIDGLQTFYDMNKPIAFDETLSGILDWNPSLDFNSRRKEAWQFILNGGAVYNYLDVTIATDDETGTGRAKFPGTISSKPMHYDGQIMRLYLKYLLDFINKLDIVKLKPDKSILIDIPKGSNVAMLANPGIAYAAHFAGAAVDTIILQLPKGQYNAVWYDTSKGNWESVKQLVADESTTELIVPEYLGDAALLIEREDRSR